MVEKLTEIAEYFRKVPAAFLVAIIMVLGLILFLPVEYAKTLAIDGFRQEYRVFLGPAFLLVLGFCVARLFITVVAKHQQRAARKELEQSLHKLTPEEKGYLVPYIESQRNTLYAGADDGVMSGLEIRRITYRASNISRLMAGYPYNLEPWARDYLTRNPHLLDGHVGEPISSRQKLYGRR